MSESGESSEDLYCYTKDSDKDEKPYLQKCDTGGCMLSYSFNRTYYDADGSKDHLEGHEEGERNDLKVLTAKCIVIDYYEECANSSYSCEHFWSLPAAPGLYHLHCCCTGSGCNQINRTSLSRCSADDCESETKKRSSCFCPPEVPTTLPTTTLGPTTDEIIVKTIIVGIVIFCSIGVYFLYTSIRKARAGFQRNNDSLHNLREYSSPGHTNITVTNNDIESDLKPLIEIPETMEERMDEKFKNFKYCSDGPNEESLLGEGRYGAVHKVQNQRGEIYAMKIFRHKGQPSEATSTTVQLMWRKEFEHLNLCADENIVKREGAGRFKYHGTLNYAILLEYCPMGSLSSYLDRVQNENIEIPLGNSLKLAQDIASGMEFLHEADSQSGGPIRVPVAHRDIKSSNILLKAPDHAVISDFGLAIALRAPSSQLSGQNSIDMDVNRTKQCGTPRYLSPELLEGQIGVHFADAFRQADVYSMSIVQWELFRMVKALNHDFDGLHELPFAKELAGRKATIESLQHIVTKGTRPQIPDSFEKDRLYGVTIKNVLFQSWDGDPGARINASTVSKRLQDLINQHVKTNPKPLNS